MRHKLYKLDSNEQVIEFFLTQEELDEINNDNRHGIKLYISKDSYRGEFDILVFDLEGDDMSIETPYYSCCGRFTVSPSKYKITKAQANLMSKEGWAPIDDTNYTKAVNKYILKIKSFNERYEELISDINIKLFNYITSDIGGTILLDKPLDIVVNFDNDISTAPVVALSIDVDNVLVVVFYKGELIHKGIGQIQFTDLLNLLDKIFK